MTISVNGVDQPETEIEQLDVAKAVVTVEPCVPLEIIVKFKLKNTQGRTADNLYYYAWPVQGLRTRSAPQKNAYQKCTFKS